jgi:diacylglycerol kinase (ATP)
MTTIAAIVSASARLTNPSALECLRTALHDRTEFVAHIVSSSDEATSAARTSACIAQIVIAVGGDGTVADVATGIYGSGAALGIIPTGSTNITARSLGIPARVNDAIAVVAEGHARRRIDVGLSGERCFLHIAGAGYDAEIFRTANRDWKSRVGWLAYLPPAATALRLAPSLVSIVADGVEIETRSSLVLVANGSATIAPTFKLHPDIAVDDGWLDLLVFTATNPGEIAATLGRLGSQRLDRSPHIIWQKAKAISIDASPDLFIELDGDVRGTTPRQFTIGAAALEIVTPRLSDSVPRASVQPPR